MVASLTGQLRVLRAFSSSPAVQRGLLILISVFVCADLFCVAAFGTPCTPYVVCRRPLRSTSHDSQQAHGHKTHASRTLKRLSVWRVQR